MTSKFNINWLNKCRCGNRMHTVETVRGSHVRLFEDDAVKCNSCGREGVIQTCDGIATVLWETDAERAEGAEMTSKLTRERIELIASFHRAITLPPSHDEIEELACMALAAMDSEPVAYIFKHPAGRLFWSLTDESNKGHDDVMPVYAAPQSPGSEPATVPGKWIPVSERMPENDGAYLCWDNRYVTTYAFIFGAWQANQFIAKNITHWMPLPAGPQEVSHG